MAKAPLSRSLRVFLALALFIEPFAETMFVAQGEGGYWDSVLWPAAVAFYGTVKEFSGLSGASLPVFLFVTVGLWWRAGRSNLGTASPHHSMAHRAMLTFAVTALAFVALGLLHGGRLDWAFRQSVHMIEMPIVALMLMRTIRVPEDLPMVGATFVLVAVARSLLVVWVYVGVCMTHGITELPGKPEWCTTHSDTVLFVGALVILASRVLVMREQKNVQHVLVCAAIIVVGIVLNNRRLAFVSLGVAFITMYLALDSSRSKRRVTAALALAAILVGSYVMVGAESTSSSPLWMPAKRIASVIDQRDASSISRDIENDNLVFTLGQNPLLPQGFGHEYESAPDRPPVDLGDVFKNFRLIAHNGVLWLWSLLGPVGFSLLWLVYPLGGTMAVHAYRTRVRPMERAAAIAALGCIAACVVQIWGDQGLESYPTIVTFGVAFAIASRLAEK